DVGIMGIMRIMRLCDWCADCNNHPNGTFCPEPYHIAAQHPPGYHMACHGVVRQGEDGRPHLVRQVRQVRH
ncbi:MAG: hypothetical protein IKC05_00140, partial [Lentisphaeria bacterium]|nr:hypothetical protein [Lentisphaeria bacterium]